MSTPFVFSSAGSLKHPKSPKSPKALENPLLKTNQFLFAPNPGLAAHEQRTPLLSVTNNNNSNHNDFGNAGVNGSGSTPTFRRPAPVKATPGPPPKKSLSFSVSGTNNGYAWQNPVAPSINTTDEAPVPPAMNTPIFGNTSQQNKRPTAFSTNTGSSTTTNHAMDVEHPLQQHWVVAYGFTNHAESHAMLEILQENGHIVSKKSGKNWIAVQYDDELSVARATCRQVVQLPHGGGVLCGIAKANGQLVQELVASAAVGPTLNQTVAPIPLPALEGQPTSQSSKMVLSNGGAKEDDILDFGPRSRAAAITPMDTDSPTDNTVADGRPNQSICEKFFHWYLGWDVKAHED
eukprot:Nitzschia sp. Nitz4//scaffold264_size26629//23267//24413//NITZ4_008240-RA/size26629-augustus-gene-0.11-mRNA-1//-1//CDS//3329544815//2396//frame0